MVTTPGETARSEALGPPRRHPGLLFFIPYFFVCVPLLLISKHTRKQLSIFFFCLCSEKPKALLLSVSHGFLSGSDADRPLPSEAPPPLMEESEGVG